MLKLSLSSLYFVEILRQMLIDKNTLSIKWYEEGSFRGDYVNKKAIRLLPEYCIKGHKHYTQDL